MNKKFFLIIIIFFFLGAVFSQEIFKFFEFSPRSTDYFLLQTNQISQEFIPFNDYLSIIGLWLENPELTKIRLSLWDYNGHLLFEKDFNIPLIEPSWWGEEYLIPLNENFPLRSGEKYKLIIEGLENNKLKIFTKNLLEIIQGSENYLYFPETLKPLNFNNEVTNYTLKLSLYEGKENTPPLLTNLKVSILNPFEVEIRFNTNEPIKYSVSYRKNNENEFTTISIDYFAGCFVNLRDCVVNLKVQPGSDYFFVVKGEDFWGNVSKLEGNFSTPREEISLTSSPQESPSEPRNEFAQQKVNLPSSRLSNEKKKLSEIMNLPLISDSKKLESLSTSSYSFSEDKGFKVPSEKSTPTLYLEKQTPFPETTSQKPFPFSSVKEKNFSVGEKIIKIVNFSQRKSIFFIVSLLVFAFLVFKIFIKKR